MGRKDETEQEGAGKTGMREKKKYCIITFHTTAEAIAWERTCQEAGLPGRIISVPREITASCGLAWRVDMEEYEALRERLEQEKNAYAAVTELMLYAPAVSTDQKINHDRKEWS